MAVFILLQTVCSRSKKPPEPEPDPDSYDCNGGLIGGLLCTFTFWTVVIIAAVLLF